MYEKLYNTQKDRIDGLVLINSKQNDIITNQDKQLDYSQKIIGGYEATTTQLVDIIKLTNKQGNKQNIVIFTVLGTLIAILVIKR